MSLGKAQRARHVDSLLADFGDDRLLATVFELCDGALNHAVVKTECRGHEYLSIEGIPLLSPDQPPDAIAYTAAGQTPKMYLTQRQEQFSNAFLLAVAAAAGCSAAKPTVDNDSIDWTLSNRMSRRPKLDVQLKCSTLAISEDGSFHFPLKKKNYDDLTIEVSVPRILVLVVVPVDLSHWMQQSADELILRRCAYWRSLFGESPSDNEESVTIYVPSAQQFTAEALNQIMETINSGASL